MLWHTGGFRDRYVVWDAKDMSQSTTASAASAGTAAGLTDTANSALEDARWTLQTAELFFEHGEQYKDPEDDKMKRDYTCKMMLRNGQQCGTKVTIPVGYGWSNAKSHLGKNHREACEALYQQYLATKSGGSLLAHGFTTTVTDKKAIALCKYMKFILEGNHAFSLIEEPNLRKLVSDGPFFSRRTMMRTMDVVATIVEEKIAARLPWDIAVELDGWEHSKIGFAGVLLKYMHEGKACTTFLRLAPLAEAGFTAENYVRTIAAFLARVEKSWDNVLYLSADNTSTNPCIAKTIINSKRCRAFSAV